MSTYTRTRDRGIVAVPLNCSYYCVETDIYLVWFGIFSLTLQIKRVFSPSCYDDDVLRSEGKN